MLARLEAIYKTHNTTTGGKMPSNHIKMAKHGLLRVQQAIKSSVSTKMIKDSFSRAGIYNSNTASYDLSKILANCTSTITIEEESQIIEVVPKLAKVLNENGELLDSDFDKHNIIVNENIRSKDNLIISRKRMVLLTNAAMVQKEEARRKKKAEEAKVNLEKKRERKEKSEAKKKSKVAKQTKAQSIGIERDMESDEEEE